MKNFYLKDANLAVWLQHLGSIHSQSIDMGLARIQSVAKRMSLHFECIKFLVGGTNGKGSTCAMLEAILLAAGYRVGLYTSPHLISYNERARINGQSVSDEILIEQFSIVENIRENIALTEFEFGTLAILQLFSQSNLDVVILEVGLGGRLDATNIIDADCSVITNVDIDHTNWLGPTREKIAYEKAHIYRSGRPAICGDPYAPESLIKYAQTLGASLRLFGRDFNYSTDQKQWNYLGVHQQRHSLAYPALRGANQLLNACTALAALESLRAQLPVPQQAVRLGLSQATLLGRFQIVPGQPTVILDVAHNPHAAAVLASNLDNMGYYPETYAIFGILNDKDIVEVINKLGPRIDHWFCTSLPGPRAGSASFLSELVKNVMHNKNNSSPIPNVLAFDAPIEAFKTALNRATKDDRIVVFGSFLTVSAILQAMNKNI